MKNIIVLAATAGVLAGCADTAQYLRSQPATHFSTEKVTGEANKLAVPVSLAGLITLHCVKEESSLYAPDGNVNFKECLYVSAEFNQLLSEGNTTETCGGKKLSPTQNLAVSYLLDVSDMNCSNFMQRVFANRSSAGFASNLTKEISTGLSGIAAFSSPGVSATLDAFTLIVGSGVKSFDAEYFLNESFQALDSAIAEKKLLVRTEIIKRRANGDTSARYGIAEALADVRAYDDACSIKTGITHLAELARDKKAVAEEAKRIAELAPTKAIEIDLVQQQADLLQQQADLAKKQDALLKK